MIGQHLMGGFEGYTLHTDFVEAIKRYKIANVILFSRNIADAQQLLELTSQIHELVKEETGYPALIGIDQEGGMVGRLSKDCTTVPSPMALCAIGDERASRMAGIITGRELNALGINVDFAPVLDVNTNANNPVIGVRSFSDDPALVGRFGMSMAEGLQQEGVIAVGKHFPGHGDTHLDSHLHLPSIRGSLASIDDHLKPFRMCTTGGISGIMSTHILFPDIEKQDLPATLSRYFMTDVLKKEYGFKGLVFSDCMEMEAISDKYQTVKASVQAIQAGIDVVLVSHTISSLCESAKAIDAALENGLLDSQELEQSTQKILLAKAMLSTMTIQRSSCIGSPLHRRLNQQLFQRSLSMVNDASFLLGPAPLFTGPDRFSIGKVSSDEGPLSFALRMQALVGGNAFVLTSNPTLDEIQQLEELAKSASSIVVATFDAHQQKNQFLAIRSLKRIGKPVLVVSMGNPYELGLLDRSVSSIAAYSYREEVLVSLAKMLKEDLVCEGTLPVSLTTANQPAI